jgi:beta-glucosidase
LRATKWYNSTFHQRVGSTSRPIRELQGFERIALQPESRQSFASRLRKRNLPIGAKAGELGGEEAEQFDVWVGGDSNAQLHGSFRVVE